MLEYLITLHCSLCNTSDSSYVIVVDAVVKFGVLLAEILFLFVLVVVCHIVLLVVPLLLIHEASSLYSI